MYWLCSLLLTKVNTYQVFDYTVFLFIIKIILLIKNVKKIIITFNVLIITRLV